MWRGWLAGGVLLVAFCAWFAWLMSQPFDPTLGAIAIGVLLLAITVTWALSFTRLGPALRRLGLGRSSTTRERRVSFALMMVAIVSTSVMNLAFGKQPPFVPAFVWLLATFGPLTLINRVLQRSTPD